MFSNRFNTKNDPLLEAVQGAMQDGEIRRQAEALVNEEFGVYSRKAVVREQLAAYDARLEEAYNCMKEGKPNDGNLANNYPPYDKVTRGDVIAGATGKDQMGGKKKVNEKKMWEGDNYPDNFSYKTRSGHMMDSDVVGGGSVTKDNKPVVSSTAPKADTSGPSASDKAALTSKIQSMKEAAYSAKAARAGKDIGKPGKSFSMIAKKAGERYGSEEKGKKVAGAILKKIRAKHMKEDQSF